MATPTRQTIKDLRAMSTPDLQQQLHALRQELWQQRLKAKAGALQQTHLIPMTRRQIARAFTVLRETRTPA